MTATDAVHSLRNTFSDRIPPATEFRGETTLTVAAGSLHAVMQHCRDTLGFDFLLDIASVDHQDEAPRFELVYQLFSLADNTYLRIKARVPEDQPEIASVHDLWPTANWHEREVWDMMGIRFAGHPDPRRILMWEGYPFHPLRKEFPLAGIPSEMPDVAFSGVAPLAGGPFVTCSGGTQVSREPRAHGA